MGHTRLESKDKDKEGAAPMDAESASPRPPLSPSNFNTQTSPPSPLGSQKKSRKARKILSTAGPSSSQSSKASEAKRASPRLNAGAATLSPSHTPSDGKAAAARSKGRMHGGLSPSHVVETASMRTTRSSPANRMNIDHLLSTPASRSPWSPLASWMMPKFTNRFADGAGVPKPQTKNVVAKSESKGGEGASDAGSSMGSIAAQPMMEGKRPAIRRDLEGAFEHTAAPSADRKSVV